MVAGLWLTNTWVHVVPIHINPFVKLADKVVFQLAVVSGLDSGSGQGKNKALSNGFTIIWELKNLINEDMYFLLLNDYIEFTFVFYICAHLTLWLYWTRNKFVWKYSSFAEFENF